MKLLNLLKLARLSKKFNISIRKNQNQNYISKDLEYKKKKENSKNIPIISGDLLF